MLAPGSIFAERHRGLWLLMCGCSWMLLFVYGTVKLLWLREWGYACVTGGVIVSVPIGAGLALWSRNRRSRAAQAREAHEAALEAQLDLAEGKPPAGAGQSPNLSPATTRTSPAPIE